MKKARHAGNEKLNNTYILLPVLCCSTQTTCNLIWFQIVFVGTTTARKSIFYLFFLKLSEKFIFSSYCFKKKLIDTKIQECYSCISNLFSRPKLLCSFSKLIIVKTHKFLKIMPKLNMESIHIIIKALYKLFRTGVVKNVNFTMH